MADDPISRISYEEDPRAQIIQATESFRDSVDAQRNAAVQFPKGHPRIEDNTVILRTPASIGGPGGVGITGEPGEGGPCSPGASCALPSGDCPHALCVSFKATRPETLEDDEYWDRGDIALFGDYNITPFFFYDGVDEPPNPADWKAGCVIGGPVSLYLEVPMTPDEFFSTSHQTTLKITKTDDTHLDVEMTAYGASDSGSVTLSGSGYVKSTLIIGSRFASNIEPIMLCGIQLRAAPANPDENDFIFPDDSFTDTLGTGQAITEGTVTITGDASGSSWVGYRKILSPPYDLLCEEHCSDVFDILVAIADIEPCGCVDGGEGDAWKLDPTALNGETTWRRTISSEGLDFTQWETDFPMAYVGALQHYFQLPTELSDSCMATYDTCHSGCIDAYSACVAGCAGDPGCELACSAAESACIEACQNSANSCADCLLFDTCAITQGNCLLACAGDPECEDACGVAYGECLAAIRSCVCYDIDTDCTCGAHGVVQCIAPTPSFPTPISSIGIWVTKGFYCGDNENVGCKIACSDTYAACMEGCSHTDYACLSACFSAANVCGAGCPGTEGCGAGGSSDINVFTWAGTNDDLFDVSHDNGVGGTCGTARFGSGGTVILTEA